LHDALRAAVPDRRRAAAAALHVAGSRQSGARRSRRARRRVHAMRGARGGPVPRLGRTAIALQAAAALAFAAALLHAEDVRLPFAGSGDWHVTAAFSDVGGL